MSRASHPDRCRRSRGTGSRDSRTGELLVARALVVVPVHVGLLRCPASSTRGRRDRARTPRAPIPRGPRVRRPSGSRASRRSRRRSRRHMRRRAVVRTTPARWRARRCASATGKRCRKGGVGCRADYPGRLPRGIVEGGLFPSDGLEPSVDVLDEVAFIIARRTVDPRSGAGAPARVADDDLAGAVGMIDRDARDECGHRRRATLARRRPVGDDTDQRSFRRRAAAA